MDKHIRKQVERIIDEGEGPYRSIIVQMATDDETAQSLIETGSEAVRRRSMSTSARDVLPAKARAMTTVRSSEQTRSERMALRRAEQSVASQIAFRTAEVVSKQILKSTGLGFLEPLISSDFVLRSIEAVAKHQRKRKPEQQVIPHFWSAASAVLEVEKDALWRLPEEVPQIAEIYPNRKVTIPPVVEVDAKNLPKMVEENKTSAWGIQAMEPWPCGELIKQEAKGSKSPCWIRGLMPRIQTSLARSPRPIGQSSTIGGRLWRARGQMTRVNMELTVPEL